MMKIYKAVIFLLILFGFKIYAQTSDLQFIADNNDGITYTVRIQIRGSNTFNLGTSNITFNYNSTNLSSPSLATAYNFNSGSYSLDVSEPTTGIASINIVYSGGTGNGTTVGTSYMNVVSVSFNVNNSSGSSNLSFRTTSPNKTGIFKDDNATLVSEGTWNSLNTSPLPVELSSFTASVNANNVNLNWKTATEVNNNGFEIQRAISGQKSEISNWEKIGFIKGHGNSSSPKEYSFTDKNITGGTKFIYRLKQIDNDGAYKYSMEIEVEVVPSTYELSQNYPNPFNPVTEIKYNLPAASRVVLNVYNIIGQQVASLVNGTIEAGYHSVTFDGSDLPSGTYIYRLQTNNFLQTKKMVLLK